MLASGAVRVALFVALVAVGGPATAEVVDDMRRAIDRRDVAALERSLRDGADANSALVVSVSRSEAAARTPLLMYAVMRGCVECASALIDAGARVDARAAPSGDTAMHAAAGQATPALFELLALHGADAKALNADAVTPLHVAAGGRSPATLKAILGRGGDVNAPSREGTPLMVAVRANVDGSRVSNVIILLGAKADPNIADRLGDTPLHAAIRNPDSDTYLRLVQALVRAGARIDVPDGRGETPAALAARSTRHEALRSLLPQR